MFVSFYIAFYMKEYKWTESLGEFGDIFGVTNALFSGLAFTFLIVGLFFQFQELGEQKKQLAAQLKEMEETKNALKDQEQQLARQHTVFLEQAYDAKFFQLLEVYESKVNCFEFGGKHGRYALTQQAANVPSHFKNNGKLQGEIGVAVAFRNTCLTDHGSLLCVLRLAIQLICFVDKSPVENKNFYFETLRSVFSISEQALLYYYIGSGLCKNLDAKKLIQEHLGFSSMIVSVLDECNGHWFPPTTYYDEEFSKEISDPKYY